MTEHKFFRVINGPVNIRSLGDTSAPRVNGQLQTDQNIEVFPDSRTINDGYVWWQHPLGWSAQGPDSGGMQFMEEILADTARRNSLNMPESTTITLPTNHVIERTFTFQRHPMQLSDMNWGQYFGNTQFAFNLASDPQPRRRKMYFYSQGLHGGIDYGTNTVGIPIVAGIDGEIQDIDRNGQFYSPGSVRVKTGAFTVIYGHMGEIPDSLHQGDVVGPQTVLGCTESVMDHLHLEVRHRNTWIINPLLFMDETMRDSLIAKIGTTSRFYSNNNWTQWQTPLDQPIIRLSNPETVVLIGPRAANG